LSALQRFGTSYEEELVMLYHLASRFARRHLNSPAQRAAYLVLVCDRTRAWSAEDVAQLKGVEKAAAERALDGFVSAGIAEKSGANPARYRWSTDMENLFDAGAADRVDPVCGMSTAADSPYTVTDAAGAVVWFCSKPCRTAFIGAPDEFAHSRTRIPANWAAAGLATASG
jgi:YHS domain-containing protein